MCFILEDEDSCSAAGPVTVFRPHRAARVRKQRPQSCDHVSRARIVLRSNYLILCYVIEHRHIILMMSRCDARSAVTIFRKYICFAINSLSIRLSIECMNGAIIRNNNGTPRKTMFVQRRGERLHALPCLHA